MITKIFAKKLVSIILLLLISLTSHSQNIFEIKGEQSGEFLNDHVFPIDLDIDKFGNFISLGYFQSHIVSPLFLSAYPDNGAANSYLIKYNASGQYAWGKSFHTNNFYTDSFSEVDSDSEGNIFIVGGRTYVENNNTDALIQKINSVNGSVSNTVSFGVSQNFENIKSMLIDANNFVHILMKCGVPVDIDPGTGNTLVSGTFIAIYDNNLNFIRYIPLPVVYDISKFTLDTMGNILITGKFVGTVDFNTSPESTYNMTSSNQNIFVSKYTNIGDFVWANHINSNGNGANATGLSIDANNNIYLTGDLPAQPTDFDPHDGSFVLTGEGIDLFLAKYNTDGTFNYAFKIGNATNSAASLDVINDDLGNIYLAGNFSGTVDFNPLPNTTSALTSSGSGYHSGHNIFVSMYNANGEFIWNTSIQGNILNRIHFDTNKNLYVQVSSVGGYMSEVTITKMRNPEISISPVGSKSICSGGRVVLNAQDNLGNNNKTYQWKRNGLPITGATSYNYAATVAGEYTIELHNVSNNYTVTSNPVIVTVESYPEVTINNNTYSLSVCDESSLTLTANATGSSLNYQWKKDDVVIPGQVNSSYAFSASQGTYSVAVSTPANCTTTREIDVQTMNKNDPSISASAIGGNPIREISENNYMFCEGGQVSLESDRSYQYYQWKKNGVDIPGATNPTFTATVPDIYTVFTTTNTGCTKLSHELILGMSVAPSLSLSHSGTVTKCINESIQFETQNLPGYTYQWLRDGGYAPSGDPGPQHILTYSMLSSSRAGVYSVRVTNEMGCKTLSPQVTLVVNSTIPQANIESQSGNVCSITGIELRANTGVDLSYQWKLNGTDIPNATAYNHFAKNSGNYTVQVSKSGCSRISSGRTITVSTPLQVSIQGPDAMCSGTPTNLMATVTTTDGLPVNLGSYTTQWIGGSATADPTVRLISSPANYTFRVTNPEYGCQYSATKTVINYGTTKPVVQRSGDICLTNSVTLTSSEAGGYLWSTGATTRSITASPSQTYTVRTFNANGGCQSGITSFYVEPCSMSSQFSYYADEEPEVNTVGLYPNPVDQELTIALPKAVEQRSRLLLVDQLGKVVSETILEKGEQKKQVSTTTFTSGIYLLKLESDEGTLMKKIMISHRQ